MKIFGADISYKAKDFLKKRMADIHILCAQLISAYTVIAYCA